MLSENYYSNFTSRLRQRDKLLYQLLNNQKEIEKLYSKLSVDERASVPYYLPNRQWCIRIKEILERDGPLKLAGIICKLEKQYCVVINQCHLQLELQLSILQGIITTDGLGNYAINKFNLSE